jgi:conjugal transfer pilus assembly protein TraW
MLKRILVVAILASVPVFSAAQNLGVHGRMYEIQEEDAVGYLKRRIAGWQKDGTVKRKQDEAISRVRETMLHPKPIPGISTATSNKTFFWDPTQSLEKPITDGKGRIIYPAGTRINPLAYGGLSKRLVFIDARDAAQVAFAVQGKLANPKDKIILTGGSWVELTKKINEQVFYDQSGYLTRRFGIHHVPAVVQQDGLKLKIEEKVL